MIGSRVGQLVITRQLGEGGMGAVYLATHQVLHTPRVVKMLLPQWTQNAVIVQRFVNEARAAASIQHRNIIAVHDCGQLSDGAWFIVMDYLEGGTLNRFCASHGGPIAAHVALQILAPIANGLEAAHAANIVHRDLKPDNIFLIQHEQNPHHPIILDFRIAKLGEHGDAVTKTGMMAGTPAYMAPEQMRDLRVVDRRTDVYALGLIAYQMVTGGWLPYQRANEAIGQVTAAELYHRQMSRPPVDPREYFAALPERWAHAILAAIQPDPARRPQTARSFAIALAEATAGDAFLPSGTDVVRGERPVDRTGLMPPRLAGGTRRLADAFTPNILEVLERGRRPSRDRSVAPKRRAGAGIRAAARVAVEANQVLGPTAVAS